MRAAEITESPIYTAGQGISQLPGIRGLGLRFPRLLRIRNDKYVVWLVAYWLLVYIYVQIRDWTQASSSDQLLTAYQEQMARSFKKLE